MNVRNDQFTITPTEHGVRVVVNGISFFRPFTEMMLLDMGKRFIEAAQDSHRNKPQKGYST
jgi:hypothetical protein